MHVCVHVCEMCVCVCVCVDVNVSRVDLGGEVPVEAAVPDDEEEEPQAHGVVHCHRPIHLRQRAMCYDPSPPPPPLM